MAGCVARRWTALLVGREVRVVLRPVSAAMHTVAKSRRVALGTPATAPGSATLARGLKTYQQFGESAPDSSNITDVTHSNDSRLVDATVACGTAFPPLLPNETRCDFSTSFARARVRYH